MRERVRGRLRRLAVLTNAACAKCPGESPTRCCSAMFCEIVGDTIESNGLPRPAPAPDPIDPTVPYLGRGGCVVTPELRPGCTGFVCPDRLRDRTFRREYRRLHAVLEDPEVRRFLEPGTDAAIRKLGELGLGLERECTRAANEAVARKGNPGRRGLDT